MDGVSDPNSSPGGSDECEEGARVMDLLSRRLLELYEQDEKFQAQLDAIPRTRQEVKMIQEKKKAMKEISKTIEREIASRLHNIQDVGTHLPETGMVRYCESCKNQFASPFWPDESTTFCPVCEREVCLSWKERGSNGARHGS